MITSALALSRIRAAVYPNPLFPPYWFKQSANRTVMKIQRLSRPSCDSSETSDSSVYLHGNGNDGGYPMLQKGVYGTPS